jgi:hypothetical protein
LALSLSAQDRVAKEYNLRTMSPEEIDQAAIGHTRYDFRITAKGALTDSAGRTVSALELADYLKQQSLQADAFFFLWLTPTSAPMDTLAPTLKPLADYGITKIVVRNQVRFVTHEKTSQSAKDLEKTIEVLRSETRS